MNLSHFKITINLLDYKINEFITSFNDQQWYKQKNSQGINQIINYHMAMIFLIQLSWNYFVYFI
jgi:hypothetical protein